MRRSNYERGPTLLGWRPSLFKRNEWTPWTFFGKARQQEACHMHAKTDLVQMKVWNIAFDDLDASFLGIDAGLSMEEWKNDLVENV